MVIDHLNVSTTRTTAMIDVVVATTTAAMSDNRRDDRHRVESTTIVGDDVIVPHGPDVQAPMVVILDVGTARLCSLLVLRRLQVAYTEVILLTSDGRSSASPALLRLRRYHHCCAKGLARDLHSRGGR
jgi:hypothetical protein